MMFTTLSDVERALEPLVAAASLSTGRDITTERTFAMAEIVGNPQKTLRVVHVAGTSGKTSTSYYATKLLQQAGKRVGLTVSPHITNLTERVQINGVPLAEDKFCSYMSEFFPLVVRENEELPSYYEVMMVFALWVFAREGVDYAVVETGLGGLHDSSNICRRADKVCVITDIGIDHTHILGSTIDKIAYQKAGIIAPSNEVVMHAQGQAVMDVINQQVTNQYAVLHTLPVAEYAEYQDRNFALAVAVYDTIAKRDSLPVLTAEQLAEARDIEIPGRLQLLQLGGARVLLDGAHNEQKMCTLVDTLKSKYPLKQWSVVIGMKQSKDYEAAIHAIASLTKRAVVVPLHEDQDMHNSSVPTELLAAEFMKYNIPCETETSVNSAITTLTAENEVDILVTGSLYVVAEVSTI